MVWLVYEQIKYEDEIMLRFYQNFIQNKLKIAIFYSKYHLESYLQ